MIWSQNFLHNFHTEIEFGSAESANIALIRGGIDKGRKQTKRQQDRNEMRFWQTAFNQSINRRRALTFVSSQKLEKIHPVVFIGVVKDGVEFRMPG